MLSTLQADIKANRPNPLTIAALVVYRFGSWVNGTSRLAFFKPILWLLYRILDVFFIRIMCSAELDARCQIGPGLRLPHGANGIIIHKDSVLGKQVTLYHQVTLGGRNDKYSSPPTLGDNVEVFAGARILGPVTVGNGSVIGANAVVINDVPAHAVAVGVPARIITKNQAPEVQEFL